MHDEAEDSDHDDQGGHHEPGVIQIELKCSPDSFLTASANPQIHVTLRFASSTSDLFPRPYSLSEIESSSFQSAESASATLAISFDFDSA